jgi:hypothetical protein
VRILMLAALLPTVACSAGTTTGAAPSYACEASDSPDSVALHDYAVRLTSGDPALVNKRAAYRLPGVPASQVRIVTATSICQQAAHAYHKAVRRDSAAPVSRAVSVIRVGTTRYLVMDPSERQGEWQVTVIFDASFAPLLTFNI